MHKSKLKILDLDFSLMPQFQFMTVSTASPNSRRGLAKFITPPPPSAPLRNHLLFYFSACSLVSLVVAEVIGLGFIGGSIESLTNTAGSLLDSQAEDALANSLVSNAAQLVDDAINALSFAATVASNSAGDTFRLDYSSGPVASYYGADQYLANASVLPSSDVRYPAVLVSLSHSAWIVADNIATTAPTLTTDQIATEAATAHVDIFLRPLYALNTAIHSFELGFENGFFRTYPGLGNILSQGAYDATARPWYILGKNNQATSMSVSISAPFLNAFGYGWIISTVKPIYSTADGLFIGVVGITSELKEFSKILSSRKMSSQVDVYTADSFGYTIASTTVNFSNIATSVPYSFLNASTPSLSTDFWQNTIVPSLSASINTQSSSFQSAEYQDPHTGEWFLILWKTLASYANDQATVTQTPSWVAIASTPLAQLTISVDASTQNLRSTLPLSAGISVAVFFAVPFLILILGWVFINQISKPLANLSSISSKISNNIGGSDLFEGVGSLSRAPAGGVDETDALQASFYSMVQTIREGSVVKKKNVEGFGANLFQEGEAIPGWDLGMENREVIDLLPDSPPEYLEIHNGSSTS
ncbi:hypothetical protein HK100_003125 [Physocladia obscura]|uniref:Uncharacterized protein n=1 Tax=Physocladia obscura TaxID=109957 RepID=A0AAD5X9M2_9FUNG|nr:hypothetical protein HK100_003125 [Physocladia obscura]